jgi:histidyl-tRNA synthetase
MSDKEAQPPANKDLARKPRGFPDKREGLIHAQARLVETVTGVYRQWGFEAFDSSAFEYADALGKFLPDDDRPNAGVFALQDDDEQWMALRYDLTAPLARFVAESGQSLGRPFRRYAAGPVWRNEKPGPGRFREFWQCDADTVGAPGFHADAEMIAMGAEALRAIGMKDGEFVVRVNTRRLLNGVLDSVGAESPSARLTILRALDKLDRLGASGVADLLGAGRKDESGDFTKGAGLGRGRGQARSRLRRSRRRNARGHACQSRESRRLHRGRQGRPRRTGSHSRRPGSARCAGRRCEDRSVRGQRTGILHRPGVRSRIAARSHRRRRARPYRIGSIGGGGRYDDLVARFTGETVPATGFSIGISRLAAALAIMGEGAKLDGPVVVLNLDKDNPGLALGLAAELRRAGIRAEAYMGASGMRPQMKYADRRNSPAVVIVGGDEVAKGTVTIKDLEMGALKAKAISSNEEYREARPGQIEVPRAGMVAAVRAIVEAQS